MDARIGHTITIRLTETPTTDGRRYIRSPDLKGFHCILDQDDSFDEIFPLLRMFTEQYVGREVFAVGPACSLDEFLAIEDDSHSENDDNYYRMCAAAVG